MKKILAAFLSIVLLVGAKPLVEVADDVVKVKNDINAAILARGGVGIGGLTNAAQRIISIPLPELDFSQTYIAWSNATKTVRYAVTNDEYQLVEWMRSTKNTSKHIMLTGVYANQDTCVEIAVSNLANIAEENEIFGSRANSNAKFGIHTYNSKISFPYYNAWNDFKALATNGLMVLKMDGNKFYYNGELVYTAERHEFFTGYPLVVFNHNGNLNTASYMMEGNFLYMYIHGAVNAENEVIPDIFLVPVISYMRQGLLDLNSFKLYTPAEDILECSTTTNMLYDIKYIQFQAQCPEPYETNIVGEVQNKLLINDATRYLYEKLPQGK